MKRMTAIALVILLLASLVSFTVNAETEGDFEYTVTDGKATVTKYLGAGGDVVIPSTLGGYPVEVIGMEAFSHCESMTSVSIPDSVTTLESFAFSGCTGLTSLVLPDSIKTIGWTFGGCTSLISVTLPNGLEELGNSAFTGCTALTSISFPSTMTTLRRYSFYRCQNLKQVVIPKSITTIEATVFFNCPNIETVYYEGTEEEWEAIDWQKSYGRTENKDLYTASIAFNGFPAPESETVWGEAAYIWSEDLRTCTAFRSSLFYPILTERETASAAETVIVPATAEAGGSNLITATFTNEAFSPQTKTVETDPLPDLTLWGDANGDGSVDNKDIVRLKNFLANFDDETGVSTNGVTVYEVFSGADANGDGSVDNKDVVRLKNYLANYDDVTGTSVVILGPEA